MGFQKAAFSIVFAVLSFACAAPKPAVASPGEAPKLATHEPRQSDFDVENYALDLALHPESRSIDGTCTIRMWPRGEKLAKAVLDLVGLQVTRVRDSKGRELHFAQDSGMLAIEFAEPVKKGEFAEFAIEYGGTPSRGLYFVGDRGAGPTQVFTQGECEDARCWYPCWDAPSDRATSEVRVTLPPKWSSIAAGSRIDHRELADGRSIDTWRMTTPHPTYLETLCAGEFTTVEKVWDNVPLDYVCEPRYANEIDAVFEETPKILQFFSDVTGFRYAYPKYAQVCVDNFQFGGMENISATTLTDSAMRDELALRDSPTFDLIAHEAAHQWFGDLMTCADWSQCWLNESFATYFDLLYVEATRGEDEFRERVRGTLESYLGADVGAARRPTVWNVWKEPMDLFFAGGQTYGGGALRLNHLRFVVGDDAFFRGIREYVGSNAGRSVVTEDFERAMEKASGQDLAWFFKQWLYSRGYPEFKVSWKYDDATKEIVLDVEQVQNFADGTPSVFRAPVEVLFGAEKLSSARIEINQRHQTLRLASPSKPVWVDFDPHSSIPRRCLIEHSLEEAQQMCRSEDPCVRFDGASVLAKTLTDANRAMDERGDALLRLPHLAWESTAEAAHHDSVAVRRVIALALASASNREIGVIAERNIVDGGFHGDDYVPPGTGEFLRRGACNSLLQDLRSDASASVRVACWQSLAAFLPSDEIVAAARKEVLETPFSWQTRVAAARIVALSDREHAADWIHQCLDIHSPHGEFESGMLGVLAEIAGDKACPIWMTYVGDERAGPEVRSTAARLLGTYGRATSGARDAITALLPSRDHRLRGAALDALQSLRDPACVPALRELAKQPLDPRHRRTLEKILASDWAGA